jgi:hypothetical protein
MTDEKFNVALAAYLEGATSADELKKILPRVGKPALAKLVIEYRDIVSAACRCVINQLEDRKSEIEGRDAVGAIDARVCSQNAASLYSMARVSAWRDGYN